MWASVLLEESVRRYRRRIAPGVTNRHSNTSIGKALGESISELLIRQARLRRHVLSACRRGGFSCPRELRSSCYRGEDSLAKRKAIGEEQAPSSQNDFVALAHIDLQLNR